MPFRMLGGCLTIISTDRDWQNLHRGSGWKVVYRGEKYQQLEPPPESPPHPPPPPPSPPTPLPPPSYPPAPPPPPPPPLPPPPPKSPPL
uniref:Uncharacterized protein n=1 Tax=Moniliophthora roreri TaxID=221103 RepID=A0A0W0EUJ9_MONRR